MGYQFYILSLVVKLTCGLMRGLTQESRKLSFTCSNITSCAKAIERSSSNNESVVSVEYITFTSWIVPIFRVCLDRTYFAETENLLLKSL